MALASYSTGLMIRTARGHRGISSRQTRVFLIDSLKTLGYTLAGLRRLCIYERFTTLTLLVRTFTTKASWRKNRAPITTFNFKEVHEWQSQ